MKKSNPCESRAPISSARPSSTTRGRGRKLFTLFREAGLREVSVHLSPLYVSAGANEQLIADYVQRFEVLTPVAMKAFGDERRYREFADAYLDLLADSDALKYAVALTVAGRRER